MFGKYISILNYFFANFKRTDVFLFQNTNQNNKDITLNALNLNALNLNVDLPENRRPSKFVDRKNVKHRNGSRSTNPSTNPSRSPSYFTEDDPEVFIMAIWVVEFSNGGYKIRKIFA